MTLLLRALLLLICLCSTLQPARAQTVADTLTRWGLIGTWALDCSNPASESNGYLGYLSGSPGKVSHERDFGSKKDSNEVQRATTGRGGVLELIVNFSGLNQTRKYSLMMGPDGRTRAMSNSRADGTEQTIKDGVFTASGKPTPWQTRCR